MYWARAFPEAFRRPTWLAAAIRFLKPDLIHTLEIRHAGYLALAARRRLASSFPPWIVSNWGSDIHLFGRLPEHQERIRSVMSAADFIHGECERDVDLARRFGFEGEDFGIFPCGGGFPLEELSALRQPGLTSRRRVVVLKGVQGVFGRALVGLEALRRCADLLRAGGFSVALPLASPDVQVAAELFCDETGIDVEVEKERWPRERFLRLYGSARVSIGLGISDAASTSMLEAMVMGAFPIQACTACADEWIVDGSSGLIVPPEDPAAVAVAVRRALTDDVLVDRAAEQNMEVAERRLDAKVVGPQVIERYRHIAGREPQEDPAPVA
jgi:glycosyl transferase family 4/glycosyl transferase family 1